MAKKQFKAESKRLLDLMINSIYTHQEIFLREIISNASDAIDKLAYLALTDENVGLSRSDFAIQLKPDETARTLTVSDNGIGMDKDEMENNLGTICRSGSLQFKQTLDKDKAADTDIIGQFGVGFYSAFMVADKVAVFGGIGSIPGAVIGAFIIGICENLLKGMKLTAFSDAFTFALLIVILVVKPTGLFGEKLTEKV